MVSFNGWFYPKRTKSTVNAFAAEGGVMQISYHVLDINSLLLRASWPQDDQQGWTISFILKVGTQRMCANEIRTFLDWCKVNSLQVQPETDRLYRYARLPPSSMWWDPDHVPVIGNKQTQKTYQLEHDITDAFKTSKNKETSHSHSLKSPCQVYAMFQF